jgi:hypothetical protein
MVFRVLCACRPEQFSNQRFLLKSIHYAATHRADMFTLPCASKVRTDTRARGGQLPVSHAISPGARRSVGKRMRSCCREAALHKPRGPGGDCHDLRLHRPSRGTHALRRRVRRATAPQTARQALERYTRALDISPAAPWQLQQLLSGREFSCYTVAHRGRVVAHADTEARLSNLSYRHIGVPQARPAAAALAESVRRVWNAVAGMLFQQDHRLCERAVQRQCKQSV